MSFASASSRLRPTAWRALAAAAVAVAASLPWHDLSAQSNGAAPSGSGRVAVAGGSGVPGSPTEARPPWAALTSSQQQALAPLKADWASIDASRKQKWLEVAGRMPGMNDSERERIQRRMAEWVRLSPTERGRARLQFQETRQLSADTRKEHWQAYQALPPDKRQALAVTASQVPKTAAAPTGAPLAQANPPTNSGTEIKHNRTSLTPEPNPAPRNVSPTVVQSRPGATTSLMTTPITPPAHHQPGLPKVNAAAGFVDPATLLPKRGPQGAAALTSAAPAASSPVRQ